LYPSPCSAMGTTNSTYLPARLSRPHSNRAAGDLGYAEGSTRVWNQWMSYMSPYASRLPYMVSIG
jgi:hypothetical protein